MKTGEILGKTSAIEWAVAARTFPGQEQSGDLHCVAHLDQSVMFAVIDGLGHGAEAAIASNIAAKAISSSNAAPLEAIFQRCHIASRGSRGVAMSIASIDLETAVMTWTGVGNVEGRVLTSGARGNVRHGWLLPSPGVLGAQMKAPVPRTRPLDSGDTIVLMTDGLNTRLPVSLQLGLPVDDIAAAIMEHCVRGTDDALVLVARFQCQRK